MPTLIKPDTVRTQFSNVIFQIEDSFSPISKITLNRTGDDGVNVEKLQGAVEPIAVAVAELNRVFGRAGISKKDCVVIETGDGTTIRINCPVVIAGNPTVNK